MASEWWRKIAATSGTKAYSLVAGMVTLVVTARLLGPEGRGTVAAISTWVALFCTIGHLSIGQVVIHQAASQRARPWLATTVGTMLLVNGSLTLLSWCLVCGLFWTTSGEFFKQLPPAWLALGFLALPFLVWEQYGGALLLAVDRIDAFNRMMLIGRTVGLILVLTFLYIGWGVAGVLLGNLAAQGLIAISILLNIIQQVPDRLRADATMLKELLSGGLKLHLNTIGAFLFTSFNLLVIHRFAGAAEAGHYQLAAQLVGLMIIVPQSAAMVLYSRIAKDGPDGAWSFHRRVLILLSLGMGAAGVIAFLLAPIAIPMVVGQAFEPAVQIFHLLLPSLLGMTVATVMAPQWIGRGLFLQASLLSLVVGLLNTVITLWLVPTYGMVGAAWATLASYTASLFTNGWLVYHIERKGSRFAT